MRLRSIPPRTLGRLAAARPGPTAPEQVERLRASLAELRLRLQGLESLAASRGAGGLAANGGGRAGSFGSSWAGSAGERQYDQPPRPWGGGLGRPASRPPRAGRAADVLIPPRSGRRVASQTTRQTPDAWVVEIEFPAAVRPEELRWELAGDVLEVEYLGRAFSYYHAFMVPAATVPPGSQPTVEIAGRHLVLRFPRPTDA